MPEGVVRIWPVERQGCDEETGEERVALGFSVA